MSRAGLCCIALSVVLTGPARAADSGVAGSAGADGGLAGAAGAAGSSGAAGAGAQPPPYSYEQGVRCATSGRPDDPTPLMMLATCALAWLARRRMYADVVARRPDQR